MGGGTGICLLTSFFSFRLMYVRYLMAFWCMFFMRVLVMNFRSFRLASLLMECSCIAPLTRAVMVMRGWFAIIDFVWC